LDFTVTDFGLAKVIRPGGNMDTATTVDQLTTVGATIGTVAYMSPEQARGKGLDARTVKSVLEGDEKISLKIPEGRNKTAIPLNHFGY
jgi:serine/threonine protein kinase